MSYKNETGKEFWTTMKGNSSKAPKTKVRISIPAGEEIKLLNIAEISSPAGVTIVLKLPFPMGEQGLANIAESIRKIGGTVDFEVK